MNAETLNRRGNPCGLCGGFHGAGPCSPMPDKTEPRCPNCGGGVGSPGPIHDYNPETEPAPPVCRHEFHTPPQPDPVEDDWRSDEEAQALIDAIKGSPATPDSGERWMIWLCTRCGSQRSVSDPPDAAFGCRARGLESPPHQFEPVEVVPAHQLERAEAELAALREKLATNAEEVD